MRASCENSFGQRQILCSESVLEEVFRPLKLESLRDCTKIITGEGKHKKGRGMYVFFLLKGGSSDFFWKSREGFCFIFSHPELIFQPPLV